MGQLAPILRACAQFLVVGSLDVTRLPRQITPSLGPFGCQRRPNRQLMPSLRLVLAVRVTRRHPIIEIKPADGLVDCEGIDDPLYLPRVARQACSQAKQY